jgi:hypothetical protein
MCEECEESPDLVAARSVFGVGFWFVGVVGGTTGCVEQVDMGVGVADARFV